MVSSNRPGWTSLLALLLCAMAVRAQTSVSLPEGTGKAVVQRMCAPCHGLSVVVSTRRSRDEWQSVVSNMVSRGATGSSEDVNLAVAYLSSHFGSTAAKSGPTKPAVSVRPFTISNAALKQQVPGETDWQVSGHDVGGSRYSPLAQITPENVAALKVAWKFDTGERGQPFEVTPLVAGNVLYLMTPNQHVVALEPETGREIWNFDARGGKGSVGRGVSYWPGDKTSGPRIVFGTDKAQIIALDAKTGKPAKDFGDNGVVDFSPGVYERYPHARYAITSPPVIFHDLAIVGPEVPEGPSEGPPGDARAFDVKSGKLVWRFNPLQHADAGGKMTWGPNGWNGRAGPSLWGIGTLDPETGTLFLPVGNPADSFYGADRPGENLYSNSIVALDAATGKMRWYYQLVHHDLFDYDVAAPPTLVNVVRNGNRIPAVAETTKMGLLFILDRRSGKPVFGAEERPVAQSDVPGEKSWPTQPFPVKPLPLARNSVREAELSSLSPRSRAFCAELLRKYPNKGPYTPFLAGGSTLFPSTMGGGNWGGVAFDAPLHLIFVNTSSFGSIGRMIKAPEGESGKTPKSMPYRNEGGYARFVDEDHYPCNQPPWGELSAVNADTGDIAWRVPLGSYDELEQRGIPKTGTPNIGGPIATAGKLVFIGATNDSHFHAFDARTGKELWTAKLDAPGETTPITYLGRDGKQYVAIATGSAGHLRSVGKDGDDADTLTVFALP